MSELEPGEPGDSDVLSQRDDRFLEQVPYLPVVVLDIDLVEKSAFSVELLDSAVDYFFDDLFRLTLFERLRLVHLALFLDEVGGYLFAGKGLELAEIESSAPVDAEDLPAELQQDSLEPGSRQDEPPYCPS